MMYSFITGIPVADILAILYYVKRLYPEKFTKELVNELILAKGVPTEEYQDGIQTQELICTPQSPDVDDLVQET